MFDYEELESAECQERPNKALDGPGDAQVAPDLPQGEELLAPEDLAQADVAALVEEHARYGWPLERGLERRLLVERLLAARALEDAGIPARRLTSYEAAVRLDQAWRHLDALHAGELLEDCTKLGFDEAGCAGLDLLACLRRAKLLEELSLLELQKECERAGLASAAPSSLCSQERHRRLLQDRLLLELGAEAYELKGLPAKRLGSLPSCARLAERYAAMDGLEGPAAREECKRLFLHPLVELANLAPAEILRQVALWEEMPLPELRSECAKHKAPVEGLFRELLDGLLLAWASGPFDEAGIPVRRLGSLEAGCQLFEEVRKLSSKGAMALHGEFVQLGLPWASHASLQVNLGRLQQFLVWQALPLPELQEECRDMGIRTLGVKPEQLVVELLSATWRVPLAAVPRGLRLGRTGPSQLPGSGTGAKRPWRMVKHLRTLRLPATASDSDVRRAYRSLALAYHPDKNCEELQERAAQKFKEATEAYEALCEFLKLEKR